MILNDTFTPKLGKIRERKPGASKRFVSQVLAEAGRGGRLGRRTGAAKAMNFGLGRGASALVYSGALPKGARRVVVKARIARHRGASLKAAKVHLRYPQRDGVTREGEAGQLYDKSSNATDGKRFMARSEGERHQFRIIIAPEDGEKLRELKPIRDLMAGIGAGSGHEGRLGGCRSFQHRPSPCPCHHSGKTDRGRPPRLDLASYPYLPKQTLEPRGQRTTPL